MYRSPKKLILQVKEQSVIPSICFPALHIFDIKMPYCGVIVPNSTTYTHTHCGLCDDDHFTRKRSSLKEKRRYLLTTQTFYHGTRS